MKLKFFFTIFIVLLTTALTVSYIHFHLFQTERMRLIDQQVEAIASSLFASELSINELDDLDDAQDIISDVVGEARMIALITIFDPSGNVQYRNRAATVLNLPVSLKSRRETIEVAGHLVRVLNLKIPNSSWYIQVGLLLDEVQLEWANLSRSVYFYLSLVLVLMVLSSLLLSKLLLKPLKSLASYLRVFADSVGTTTGPQMLPLSLRNRMQAQNPDELDEFGDLLQSVSELANKLENRFRLNQSTSAQMAHELKTPLTIVKNSLESIQREVGAQASSKILERIQEANEETDHLTQVISHFLDWSRAEHERSAQTGIHALRLDDTTREICAKLEALHPNRIDLHIQGTVTIFARPDMAWQAFQNLIENALRYSPVNSQIKIVVTSHSFSVEDQGHGIPAEVLNRIGQPFNAGPRVNASTSSTGLGLAWAHTVCRLYGWKLTFENKKPGTRVKIEFPGP